MKKLFGKTKKVATSGIDFGNGVRSTVSADNMEQEELDTVFGALVEMSPRIYECAFRHLEEFSENDQELIKAVWDGMQSE